MSLFGALGFTAPWLLAFLLALPLLWLILRAVPPAPVRRRFPGVALLLGLTDDESQTDRTPWWLLLLRILAVALVIIGFAGPVLNPAQQEQGNGPLLIVVDGTWADARDWPRRMERVSAALAQAGRAGRPVAVVSLTDLPAGELPFQSAEAWRSALPGIAPMAWAPDAAKVTAWATGLSDQGFDTLWLSDGVDRPERAELLAAFEAHGAVRVFESPQPVTALYPATYQDGTIHLRLARTLDGPSDDFTVVARGLDPAGVERDLARVEGAFEPGDLSAELDLVLPAELRNRVSRFELEGVRSAGAVSLTDDALRRREVALISARNEAEELELLSPLHYLRQALATTADLIESDLASALLAHPDVVVLADVARLSPAEEEKLQAWVEAGGMLLRFAGPRLAASDVSRVTEDPLLPVRLREGGRSVGGAMSWGTPKTLRPFDEGSPFYGLPVPEEVTVTAQVLAQPDPTLAERSIASLADGTPLVTRKDLGAGQVVLVHVTANAEWSNLPLSGLFMSMLERLAISTRPTQPDAADLAGTTWIAQSRLDAYGALEEADDLSGIPGERLAEGVLSHAMPPGLYRSGARLIALNVVRTDTAIAAPVWPDRIPVEGLAVDRERPLKGGVLSLALLLLCLDLLASMWLSGKLPRLRGTGIAVLTACAFLGGAPTAKAQTGDDDIARAIAATSEAVLAYVQTGDPTLDEVTEAGLAGLSYMLNARTSVEPAAPIAVNLETDELSFFPLLYWSVSPSQPLPSAAAYEKLNRFLRTGGMIVFDTHDGDVARYSNGGTPEGRRLQQIAAGLDIPPLEPVPADHVLTRAFYLLQDFPGRYVGQPVWVEAAPEDAVAVEGVPFRNLNDGVTPVVIGGNDWAAAWAVDETGRAAYRIGSGLAGERQREIAIRFGINLVMHVLTGNYKSDQVHVPALLDRLGN